MKTNKIMTNLEVAELLRDVAAAYKIKEEKSNRFKIVAYERAADAIEHLSSEIKDLWDEGKLNDIPGVGDSITTHLDELFRTGLSTHFEKLMEGLPKSLFKLMELPGIGPKKAYRLAQEFNIDEKDPFTELEKIAKEGKIESLDGFGRESQEDILNSIDEYRSRSAKRLILPYAMEIADEISSWMREIPQVLHIDPLGSLRRRASTVGDIDLSVSTDDPDIVMDHFVNYPKKVRIIEKGPHSATLLLAGGVHADLMVMPPERYGALLQHFTGSKHHNIALREYALKKGYSLSERGIKDKGDEGEATLREFKTETEFYNYLGLDYVPPELREDMGEIEAAVNKTLPISLKIEDIKADLQIHSDFDIETSHDLGASSMEDIVKKADNLGYEYIAFTEHNPSHSKHTKDAIVNLLKKKKFAVDQLNKTYVKDMKTFKRAFNSLEIDILPDGTLPVPNEGFEHLDFALVSIHSSFKAPKEEMTKRVLTALAVPKVKIFAHPTARKINHRESVELDWDQIFTFCLQNDKWIEINAEPMRLDLPDFLVREAVRLGVKLTMGTDAHHIDGMNNMKFGVYVANRGWATRNDIINTLRLAEFENFLYRN